MRAIVVGEYRLFRGTDGRFYAESVFGYDFWQRYLDVFEEVLVVARVAEVSDTTSMLRVDGPCVDVHPMPYYIGLGGYVRSIAKLRQAAREVSRLSGAVVLRVPGAVASTLHACLQRGRPFAVEIVGDPMEVFAPGVVEPPLRRAVRWAAVRRLRAQAKSAVAVAYVSRFSLAEGYPASAGVPTFAYSSASLSEDAFAASSRIYSRPLRRIIAVGSMDQMYKGFDVLLRAVAVTRLHVSDLHLTIVGGGRHRSDLERLASELGIKHSMTFTGVLSTPAEVRDAMDEADILVSASLTEGLPRTVLEAQARGLPCIATRVGATPDLLREQDMCAPADAEALSHLLIARMRDPAWATTEAARGWNHSRLYDCTALQEERNRMFWALRGEVECQ